MSAVPETATGIATAVGAGDLKATEVVQASLDRLGEPVLTILADIHGGSGIFLQRVHTGPDVAELGFQHVDDGVVRQVGVRTIEHEQVGKAADGDALEGGRAVFPGVVEGGAVAADNLDG